MTEALIDTDILSFYFKGDSNVVSKFKDYLKEFDQINISIITFYEIIGGLKHKKADRQLQEFEDFISNNNVIYISEDSARKSSEIYADLKLKGLTIGTSDILIAGIALDNELVLVTNNEKHYAPIRGLKIENWKA
ncbi:MAG: type II toxin-antitoxin system VapC family toxin [Bacteroidia bacterium]|nr:type II toxin-antitoxin system VapC family toxin [Bacteroidia bacterium]